MTTDLLFIAELIAALGFTLAAISAVDLITGRATRPGATFWGAIGCFVIAGVMTVLALAG